MPPRGHSYVVSSSPVFCALLGVLAACVAGCDLFGGGPPGDVSVVSPRPGVSVEAHAPVSFTWQPVDGADYYEVALTRQRPGPAETTVIRAETASADTVLSLGAYSWRVRAVNDDGGGDWSAPSAFVSDFLRREATRKISWQSSGFVAGERYQVNEAFIPHLSTLLAAYGYDWSQVADWTVKGVEARISQPQGATLAHFSRMELWARSDSEQAERADAELARLMAPPDRTAAEMMEVAPPSLMAKLGRVPTLTFRFRTSSAVVPEAAYTMEFTVRFLFRFEV